MEQIIKINRYDNNLVEVNRNKHLVSSKLGDIEIINDEDMADDYFQKLDVELHYKETRENYINEVEELKEQIKTLTSNHEISSETIIELFRKVEKLEKNETRLLIIIKNLGGNASE